MLCEFSVKPTSLRSCKSQCDMAVVNMVWHWAVRAHPLSACVQSRWLSWRSRGWLCRHVEFKQEEEMLDIIKRGWGMIMGIYFCCISIIWIFVHCWNKQWETVSLMQQRPDRWSYIWEENKWKLKSSLKKNAEVPIFQECSNKSNSRRVSFF